MPEKPEVVTVCKVLEEKIIGKKITGCNVYWDNIIEEPNVSEFKNNIIGENIHSVNSRGKFIVIELDRFYLLIHLRMEGKFTFRNIGDEFSKHEHVEFILDDVISWRYHDVRKFGRMYLLLKGEAYSIKPLKELGYDYYEPLLTGEYLYSKFQTKKLPIKTVLLDQSIIAGIGNIYANEILFLSGISPEKKACEITKEECDTLIINTRDVLDKAIELGGTTIKSFTSAEGVHGLFQTELMIHGRDKEPCKVCGTMVEKIYLNGRGTYYCPKCQK